MPLISGPLTIRTVFDQASIDAVHEAIADAIDKESSALLVALANEAVKQLTAMDDAAGHRTLATLWDHEPVKMTSEGLAIEVYSHAEDMTFHNISSATGRIMGNAGQTWPIDGGLLVSFLQEGTKPHEIFARYAKTLAFGGQTVGRKKSRFAGTVRTKNGFGVGSFAGDGDATLFPSSVDHPGFAGDHFLDATRQTIEDGLDAAADQAATNVARRVK